MEKAWPAPTCIRVCTQMKLCVTIPSVLTQIRGGARSLAELTGGNSLYANFFQRGAAILPALPAGLFSLVTILTVKSSNICVEMS